MKRILTSQYWQRFVLERLHRIFAIVIVIQLIRVFTDYWWEETYAIVYGVLAVTAVTELLFTRGFLWRLLIQWVSAVAFTVAWSDFTWYGWPDSWRKWEQVKSFFLFHADELHPFFELAVGIVVLVHLMSWLGKSRAGAIFVILCAILVMAAVDSFFPLELWHNIAWIVTAGLAWLVIVNLRHLQARHPESWTALAARPFELAVPAVVIISLLLLTGIFMPRAPVLLEDPYTIWTEAQGREVPAFEGEGGVLINNTGSKGSSLSGYSRDDRRIGGGFQFDYSPVMTITTSQRSYWRGETKAIYTGKGWGDRKNPNLIPYAFNNEADLPLVPERSDGVETIEVIQTVTVLRKDKIPVLFAAGPASSVTDLKSDNNGGLMWNPEEWELRWNKSSRVESYSVVSQVAVLDEEALRQTTSLPNNPQFDPAPYLQLPDSLPQRVRDLAQQMTDGLSNDYDRAKQLEQYLKTTFPYTNTPDVGKMTSVDVTDAFLFEIKEGYCDYFSTAFVVMARSIGLPARWVKGYATGFDQNGGLQRFGSFETGDRSGAGTYTVRNADAHSWAEVYFEGYGWIPFEPTSGFSVPQPLPEGEVAQPEPSATTSPTPKATETPEAETKWTAPVGTISLILAILALAYLVYRRKSIALLVRTIRYHGTTPDQRIVRDMERLLSYLHRRGFRREAHETMRETFERWSGKFSSLRPEFEGVLADFEQARYGEGTGSEQHAQTFAATVDKIRKAL